MDKAIVTDISGRDGFRTVRYGDKTFVVKPFVGKKGLVLTMKLTKYATGAFGGLLAGAVTQIQGGTEVEKLDAIGILLSGVVQGAFEELDDEKFHEFFFDLFSNVFVDNTPLDFDKEFTLNYGLAFDLVRHIITYNFASVFTQLGIDALLKKKETKD